MSGWQLNTPVAFVIFNRPDTTEQVFAEIAKAKPPKLLVVADGPRANRPGEAERCAQARAVIGRVDWDCEILTNYSDVNLGCRNRVSSGLDWVFGQVPEAIILEDDCLPHPTFFRFCEELLDYYRDDERIGMISGDNFQMGRRIGEGSYYFSRFTHIWGWASWRRAWQHYDRDAKIWPEFSAGQYLDHYAHGFSDHEFWRHIFKSIYARNIDTWDYQWTLAHWSQGMVSVTPNVNLVSNIGFGADATHTKKSGAFSDLPTQSMLFPLVHPSIILPNPKADKFTSNSISPNPIVHFLQSYLKRMRK